MNMEPGKTARPSGLRSDGKLKGSVNGIVVFWLVTNRLPGKWNFVYGAAHNLSVRTNNALARTVRSVKLPRDRLENGWEQPCCWRPHSNAGTDCAAAGGKRNYSRVVADAQSNR
jgi:hypothetical protein